MEMEYQNKIMEENNFVNLILSQHQNNIGAILMNFMYNK